MKKIVLLIVSAFFLLSINIVTAQDIEVEPKISELRTSNGTNVVEVVIKNNQNADDEFSLSVFGPLPSGLSIFFDNPRVQIEAKASKTVKLIFNLPECIDEVTNTYKITAASIKNKDVSGTANIILTVFGRGPVCLTKLDVNKLSFNPEETLEINVEVSNVGDKISDEHTVQTKIRKDSDILERFEDTFNIPSASSQKISHVYTFGKYDDPGEYTIESTLVDKNKNLVNIKGLNVKLSQSPQITKQKDVQFGLLIQTTTIKVKNEGNFDSDETIIKEIFPAFMKNLINSIDKPLSVEEDNLRVVYSWNVGVLKPREERQIVYQINITSLWVISIFIIAFLIVSLRYVGSPKVLKRYRLTKTFTGEKEIIVSLDVRNKSNHMLKDVYVKDYVPSIAKVVEKFETLKPILRRAGPGTQLVWKIDQLRPREERILNYRIKPTMEIVGQIKLPRAYMSFTDKKKQIKKSVSKSLLVKIR